MCYNLLEEKWIPVLWKCGKPGRAGIRGANILFKEGGACST